MDPTSRAAVLFVLTGTLSACSRTPPPNPEATSVAARADGAAGTADQPALAADAGEANGGTPCAGDPAAKVTCLRFPTAEEAFRSVIRAHPTVLAIGEAHAQKGTEAFASSTKRFTDQLLPLVANDAADIVVELWAPDPRCQKAVKEVASAQRPVVESQASANQNEYVVLGTRAKELGMTPWLLRPTCDDFSALADAGADAVPAMLSLVKRLTLAKLDQLLPKNAKSGKMTLAYGGAMHNDVAPPEATAPYSFGPELARRGNYIELDLIVPEYVKKTPVWEKLPWFSAWEKENAGSAAARGATVYTIATTPPSYVLVFPRSAE